MSDRVGVKYHKFEYYLDFTTGRNFDNREEYKILKEEVDVVKPLDYKSWIECEKTGYCIKRLDMETQHFEIYIIDMKKTIEAANGVTKAFGGLLTSIARRNKLNNILSDT